MSNNFFTWYDDPKQEYVLEIKVFNFVIPGHVVKKGFGGLVWSKFWHWDTGHSLFVVWTPMKVIHPGHLEHRFCIFGCQILCITDLAIMPQKSTFLLCSSFYRRSHRIVFSTISSFRPSGHLAFPILLFCWYARIWNRLLRDLDYSNYLNYSCYLDLLRHSPYLSDPSHSK